MLVQRSKAKFSGNERKTLKLPKNFLLILEFPINLSWSMQNQAQIVSSEPWNICSRLYNAKFVQPIQNHFSGKARQTLRRIPLHVGISNKLDLKTSKRLNLTLWAIECWYKAQKCKIPSTNTKPLYLLRIFEFPINLFWTL